MAMRKKFYGVRTKCDPGNDEQENDQVRQQDIDNINQYEC